MSWNLELPIIVRTLINDWADTPVYSDERIVQVLTVAAKYVQFDVVLDHEYQINVINNTITPDPTVDSDRDEIFVSLVALKAACIVDQSTFRTKAAMEGLRASLGPAAFSVGGSLAGWKEILEKGPCALYSDFVEHWDVANASSIRAILSPFAGNKFDPSILGMYSSERGRTFFS